MAKTKTQSKKPKSTLAKTSEGTIQITFTVPKTEIESAQKTALEKLKNEVHVSGFRKGKAPLEKVKKELDQEKLLQSALKEILPQKAAAALKEHQIKSAIYPKIEILKAKEGEDWQFRLITCELPEIELGNYQEKIKAELRSSQLWVPGKKEKSDKEPTPAEKEQAVLNALLKTYKLKLPHLLIQEEVNSRLASLLSRLEKLGLKLEDYLNSIGKTSSELRQDYEKQGQEALILELVLTAIAEKENLKPETKTMKEALEKSQVKTSPAHLEAILKRRAALESLVKLI